MLNRRQIFSLGVLAVASLPVLAEPADTLASGSDRSNPIRFERTTPEVAKILKEGQAPEPSNPPAPAFVVKTANNNFIMTIGGQINTVLGFDIGNNLFQSDGVNFTTANIPVPAQKGHKGDFFISPLTSNIHFQVVGLGGTKNQITGFFKLGTNGVNSQIVLKRAYVKWRNITVGKKSTLMEDGDACQPPTIDNEGPSGEVSGGAYEIAYNSPSYGGFRWAIALDKPTFEASNGVYRGKDYPKFDGTQVADYGDAEQIVPDIPAWVEYSFSPNNRVRLTGIFRNFAYRDLLADKTRHSVGWGAMLSGNIQPASPLLLYYQFAYGKGIANYIQDISGHPFSFIPTDEKPGHMSPSPMMGWTAGATYNATPKLQFNAMFSQARVWEVASYANALDEGNNYRYALYGAANCFYNITSYIQAGVEYVWGRRTTWNGMAANDSRIQTQLSFSF